MSWNSAPEQPHVDTPVTAVLTDSDGILMIDPFLDLQTVTTWQWYVTGSDAEITLQKGDLPDQAPHGTNGD